MDQREDLYNAGLWKQTSRAKPELPRQTCGGIHDLGPPWPIVAMPRGTLDRDHRTRSLFQFLFTKPTHPAPDPAARTRRRTRSCSRSTIRPRHRSI